MAKSSIGWDNLFTYDTLVHAMAGSVGSVTAMSVFFPLDTIRSRLQVEDSRKSKDLITMIQELIKEEGIESLYRGLHPVLVSVCASNFVYFYTFHGLRSVLNTNHSISKDLMLGMIAGVVNVLSTTPLWVVNMRMKMQGAKLSKTDKYLRKYPEYRGIVDGLVKIGNSEGINGLWSGMLPSLVLVSNPAIQFMIYEALKREAKRVLSEKQLTGTTVFILGAVSKCISTLVTYPLQIVQSRQRYGTEETKRMSMLAVMKMIIQSNGIHGLYKGLESKLWQTVLTAALMFWCYEKIAAFVFQIMKGKKAKV